MFSKIWSGSEIDWPTLILKTFGKYIHRVGKRWLLRMLGPKLAVKMVDNNAPWQYL